MCYYFLFVGILYSLTNINYHNARTRRNFFIKTFTECKNSYLLLLEQTDDYILYMTCNNTENIPNSECFWCQSLLGFENRLFISLIRSRYPDNTTSFFYFNVVLNKNKKVSTALHFALLLLKWKVAADQIINPLHFA